MKRTMRMLFIRTTHFYFRTPTLQLRNMSNRILMSILSVVLQISEGTILDDENVALAVLNNSELTIELNSLIFLLLRITITSIKEITDALCGRHCWMTI